MLYKQLSSITLAVLLIAGCESQTPSFYKLDVRQGNLIEQDQITQLHPGMSKRQVQAVLGSPLLIDPFHQDRWDYIYVFYPRGNRDKGEEHRLTLFFENEALTRMSGDLSEG